MISTISEPGMFTQRPNNDHSSSFMLSSIVERFSGVRLGSENTHRETEMEKTMQIKNAGLVLVQC